MSQPMTSALVHVADAAVPFDYAALPADVVAVLGYVGQSGATPHIWSTAEAEAARKAVGAWSAIWTPPQGLITRDDGYRAAEGMIAVLPQYAVGHDSPVFLDIERHSFDAHPSETREAIRAFVVKMHGAGWSRAFPYAPVDYGSGWIAHYVTARPTSLPAAYIGQQYTNNGDGGSCDLSVFRREVFSAIIKPSGGDDVALDKADKAWILKQLETQQHNIVGTIEALHSGKGGGQDWPRNVAQVSEAVDKLAADIGNLRISGPGIEALADAVAVKLGPALAAEVLDAAAKRLAT